MDLGDAELCEAGELIILINAFDLNITEEVRYDDGGIVLNKFTDEVSKVLNKSEMLMNGDNNEAGIINLNKTWYVVDGFD
jgi:hypothetical protein